MRPLVRALPLLFAAAALTIGTADPASAQYRIDTWTIENGLPQSSITGILQTRDGFLWLSTYGGLVRFDGAKMQVFTTVNAPGMRTSRLTGLFEAPDGALWVTTEAHGVIRYQDGAFVTYTTAQGLPDHRVHGFSLENGEVIAETDRGTGRWDGTRFVPYTTARPTAGNRDRVPISPFKDGVTWYRDREGLHRFSGGRVTRTVPGLHPRRVYEDRAGRLWMETGDRVRVLHCLTSSGLRTFGEKDGMPSFATATFTEDIEGNVWIGLRSGGGLLRFDGQRFTRYTTADGLPSDNVGGVYQDREGTRWAATDGGLARLTVRSMTSYSSSNGLESDNIYPILQDRHGDVWIGGWRGLTRYRDGIFTPAASELALSNENVMSLAETRDGALWIGTWGGGVRRVHNGTVTTYLGRDGSPGTVVRAMHETRQGELWLGGPLGLSRFRGGTFTSLTARDGYTGGEVYAFLEDRAGTLWIGTATGLTRYRDGVFTHFDETAGLTGSPVRAIHEDADGSLWLGTYDSGLFRFRNGRFTRYTTREGLFTNGAFQIIEDEHQRFWITSNSGIYRVPRRDLDALAEGRTSEVTSVPYGRRDGMLNPECNGGGQPAGIRARDGRIWFPTQQGVVVFDPNEIPIAAHPPPVLITSLLVADQPVALSDSVEIRGGPRSLEIQYAALTFIRPELSRFRYRMAGLDSRWIDAGHEQRARFAQLPYGSFDFQVIAANRDGLWNEQGAHVRVVVVAPFWRTRWFLGLVAAGIAGLALAGHRARVNHLRRQAALRVAFSRQLIDSQEGDRRRIAAGLHDGLSQNLIVIRNWALLGERTLAEDHASNQWVSEIAGTAALALEEVRAVVHDLAPYNLDRLGLAQSVEEMVDRVAGSTAIRFKCRIEDVGDRLPKAAQINLYRVVQEAINNIVKHSGAQRAWIEMDADGDALRVAIRDDGRGFDVRPEARMPGAGGFGLLGMAERLRMVGGEMAIESSAGQGTSIMIELPLEAGS